MFTIFDKIIHGKTGGEYTVVAIPQEYKRLEYNNETYYEYYDQENGMFYLRCKSEMEDGRFKLQEISND